MYMCTDNKTAEMLLTTIKPNLFRDYLWMTELFIFDFHFILPTIQIFQQILQFFGILANI